MSRNNENSAVVRVFESVVHTDVGRCRQENQDSYCVIERPEYCFYGLADGMGGVAGGSLASSLAIAAVKEYIESKKLVSEPVLREAVRVANKRVLEKAIEEQIYKGMGTTFVALAFAGKDMFVANVGDSRAYRFREGRLTRLTEDHTLRVLLEHSGVVSSKRAEENPMSHLLTRSVGTAEAVEIDCWRSTDPPLAEDIYLLCTDGLHVYLKEYEIARELETCPFDCVAEKLSDIANERGGSDNITVIAARANENFSVESSVVGAKSPVKTAGIHANSTKVVGWIPNVERPLIFLSGLLFGVFLFNSSWKTPGTLPEMAAGNAATSAAPEYAEFMLAFPFLPPVEIQEGKPAASLPNVDALSAQDIDGALSEFQEHLKRVRQRIEIATRKLSVWHERREDFFVDGESKELATQVAASVDSVRRKVEALEAADWKYRAEAEKLLYNPADSGQEKKVSKLRLARNKRAAELRAELQTAIDRSVGRELYRIRALSLERDRIQSSLEAIKVLPQGTGANRH